jgi:phosphatidylserine/phosphatidylglycerophosphate/cardiolipin synthase-like enzyme
MKPCLLAIVATLLLSAGCASHRPMQQAPMAEVLADSSSAGPLAVADARVLLYNDAAFAAKLELIKSATQSLDLAYYIHADDYSSSVLSQALIDAARRGVKVRLLLDYFSAYRDFDRLAWLEQAGAGKLEVRLFNPPTAEIIKDAAFMTLGCADVGAAGKTCEQEKLAAIDQYFASLALDGTAPSDSSYAGSALFLSGLYGKHPQLMAYAITHGQDIDREAVLASAGSADPAQGEQLKQLGKLYFKARYVGGVEGLAARLKLALVRVAFAEQVNPVFDALNSYLPLSRESDAQAQLDWDYLTSFLHHKFLLVDGHALLLGGRNIEDAYHMQPGPLADKYIFMDTDIVLRLNDKDERLLASFDRLWELPGMVASLQQVRKHAPNDFLMNFAVLETAQSACKAGTDEACVDKYLARHFVGSEQRIAAAGKRHQQNVGRYQREYRPAITPEPMSIDAGARIHYLENLPVVDGQRIYGAPHNGEAGAGKAIHALWRSAIQETCARGADGPRDIIVHNAYLFMPANLLHEVAAALDGSRECQGVTLSLVTNSLATTDLSVVNLLSTWQLKALADHLQETPVNGRGASLRYHEYRASGSDRLSLHSKFMLFGDDVFIGSANADVRSLMLDSNNGVFIRQAPVFVSTYKSWLNDLLQDPKRTVELTQSLGRDETVLVAEMDAHIDQLLGRYADERLSKAQEQSLRDEIRASARRVYELSRQIMRGNRKAAEQFNALFKAI